MALALLLGLSGSPISSAKDNDERIYYAVRINSGMILREPGASDDRCIDVYGRTPAIEAIVPADGERYRIAGAVRIAAKAKVHPPTYSSIAEFPGISSSAYVIVRGEPRFLECSIDTIYVLDSARKLEKR
ncbi:hypothetical protein [Sphingopyxis sp. PET50]|uniref:hypothetical protein n=1 Tax=Sphingopyxis sp. PET50 TaxID=2976533 RepID=UPI0021AE6FF5|nr:hypothetical protein [Sphingopyxis sp. PET50]